ncbi:MAG: multidrug effflux MFS transporter [Paracoccaceae bacterium]
MRTPPRVVFLDRTTPPHISTLIVLAGVSAMAMNMFLPSLPNMAKHFGVSYAFMQLTVPLYLGVSAVLQTIIGPLSDKFGRRPILLWGLALFVLFSLICVNAPNAEIFLFSRMAQASIAVGMVLSRAAIRDIYDQEQAASMIGFVTMGMALVPMISPVIGGALDQLFGWKAVFWAFVLIGLIAFAMTWNDLGETAQSSGKTLIEQFKEYPELFRSYRFWGYAMSAAFSSGAFFSFLGGAPFVGSELFGLSPFWLGFCLGAPAIGYAIGNGLTGRYARKIGINRMILIGSCLNAGGVTVSLIIFLLGYGTSFTFFGLMTFVGLGNGFVMPNATAGLLSVRPHLAGTASGLGGAIMIGGGAALSALAGSLLTVETGAFPLLWIQVSTAVAGLCAISAVFWRERQVRLA